ncbi:hypothetical protein KP509_02G061600 [Ceratopteris richardii]|uniref:DUF7722 domain-containing protein n=1 Tax=Ceratopteris richardii TaxID=49495 RepID=A0A8T2VAD5_CERRI|nr:hypothetical protein KP509_02G061600 [Ceratopteris richardii]
MSRLKGLSSSISLQPSLKLSVFMDAPDHFPAMRPSDSTAVSNGSQDHRVHISHILKRVSSLEQIVQDLLDENTHFNLFRRSKQRVPDPSTSLLKSYSVPSDFQMPLHYPRFSSADYYDMEEWRLERLLEEYGLNIPSTLEAKRDLAIGTFLWENQRN